MAQPFFPLACLLLVLATQHSVRADELTDVMAALESFNEVIQGSSEAGLGSVVAFLAAEHDMFRKKFESDVSNKSEELQQANQKIQETNELLKKTKETIQDVLDYEFKLNQGSTFVRWGRRSCPVQTKMVYSGIAAGKPSGEQGSGPNHLCLTNDPIYDDKPNPTHYGKLVAIEYESMELSNQNVPCSVCQAPQATTIMIPGTFRCPVGWTEQYSGKILTHHKTHWSADYLCVDGNHEALEMGGSGNDALSFFYRVTVSCNSLPCPPYKSGFAIKCAVCSK